MKYIEMLTEDYINCLDERRNVIEPRGWIIPDCVWNYFIKLVEDCGVDRDHADPAYVVDNIAVNADYGLYENYKQEGETDEEFEQREIDNAMAFLVEETGEKYVVYSL